MKTLKTLMPIFLLAVLFSCGDDDSESKPENYSLDNYLAETGFDEETEDNVDAGDYEFGLRFKPTVNGAITEINVMLPDNRTDLRVTIWDAATQDDIHTETITTVTANTVATKTITPVALEKDKEYMITFNSNDWYNRYRTDGAEITYPITFKHIVITGYGYISGTAQAYPVSFPTDYYAGDLTFVFEKD